MLRAIEIDIPNWEVCYFDYAFDTGEHFYEIGI